MTKALGEVPEIEEVSPELEDIKKDPLNSVVGDITTQDDPQIKQSASTPNDLWESWLEKKESWDKEEKREGIPSEAAHLKRGKQRLATDVHIE